jgi:hypothetical protein
MVVQSEQHHLESQCMYTYSESECQILFKTLLFYIYNTRMYVFQKFSSFQRDQAIHIFVTMTTLIT